MIRAALVRAALLFVLAAVLPAQETRSAIYGVVSDPQGAPVAGVAVLVTHTGTNTSTTLKTNDTGYYEAALLLPGKYTVSAELAGFKKIVESQVELPVSTRQELNIRLQLGAVSEIVNVTAEAPLVESDAVSSGMTVDERSITELPVVSDSTLMLAKFAPGMQSDATLRYLSFNSQNGASGISIAGGVGGNNYALDGAPNLGNGRAISYIPHSETVQEFRIQTSSFDASIGGNTGAYISMMTKSGTNQYHGALTELHWQQRWECAPFFTRQLRFKQIAQAEAEGKPEYAAQLRKQPMMASGHSNNYSASLGGPVRIPKLFNGRDKLFFFFAYNAFKDIKVAEGTTPSYTLPTMANRQGDFSDLLKISLNAAQYQVYDPSSVRVDPARAGHYIRTPFAGNLVPQSRIANPAYAAYVKFLPVPNNPIAPGQTPTNNYLAIARPYNWDYRSFNNRVDYHQSGKSRFFLRWSWFRYAENREDWTYTTSPGLSSTGEFRTNPSATVDWVFTPTATTIVNVNTSVNNFLQTNINPVMHTFKPSDVGLPAYMDEKAGEAHVLPTMSFSGYQTVGQPEFGVTYARVFSFHTDITHIHGRHSLRAGVDSRQYFRTGHDSLSSSGNFAFDNKYTRGADDTATLPAANLGLSWAAFMTGVPTTASLDTKDTLALHNPWYGWFVADNWRATRTLTLNLGLRMEYEAGPTERYNRAIASFDPTLVLPTAAAALAAYTAAPVPELAASAFKVLGGTVYAGPGSRHLWGSQSMLLPRASAAWAITPKMALRFGWGIYYDSFNVLQRSVDQTGFSRSTSTTMTNDFGITWNAGMKDPFPIRADGTRFNLPTSNALGSMAKAGQSFSFISPDQDRVRQHQWRVSLQRQVGGSTVVDIGYAGSSAPNAYLNRNLNPLPAPNWIAGLVRDTSASTNLDRNVTNPFYINNFAALKSNTLLYSELSNNGFFSSGTIAKHRLLRPFTEMTGLTQTSANVGRVRTDALELRVTRRFSKGFNLNFAYTRLNGRAADYMNEFDPAPSWQPSGNVRPHRITGTGIYDFPFGKGRKFWRSGIRSAIFGGFQTGVTYEYQAGPRIAWSDVFYYGDIGNITAGDRSLDRWFNNTGVACSATPGPASGFERCSNRTPAGYHVRSFPKTVPNLRADGVNVWNSNIVRTFRISERASFQFRFDAINLGNRSQFSAPNISPTSTDFGRITSTTTAQKRFIQIQGKIRF